MTDNTFLHPANRDFPVPIKYGPGRIAELGVLCAAAGCRKPLIVTDRATVKLPFVARLIPEPTIELQCNLTTGTGCQAPFA